MKTYFYDNEVKKIQKKNSFAVEKFIVYEIEHDGNIDIAERRVKTITSKLKRDNMTNDEKILRGKKLAEILNLKLHYAYAEDTEKTRYHTTWGDKTALGLYETVKRILHYEN